jgi:hypothetical protein
MSYTVPGKIDIKIWNAFLTKRAWCNEASADLQAAKERNSSAIVAISKPGWTYTTQKKEENSLDWG